MNKTALRTTFIALFTALICIGGIIKIPLGLVPIVIQNAMCILTAVILGGIFGGMPTLIFFLAGLIGLPVFAGGTGGFAFVLGPTGGFYIGYVVAAFIAGFIAGKPSVTEKKLSKKVVIRVSLAMILGMAILYIPAIPWFAHWATANGKIPAEKTALAYTMGAAVLPYIPGDILKIIVAIPVALKVRPILAQYLYEKDSK
ncbi:biotin transporter BioY [Treponema zioleckii]|uniref:biotin transporter BioY n=1 Tax=Treponema zioleckii TaxID=331680 RepID=UPI00168A7E2F|nr:biotin transporter BioY [Treponema zioleckii]